MVLAKGRTVADTSVSNVHCEEVKRGESSPELEKNGPILSRGFTSSQWTLHTTRVAVTVLPLAKARFSESETRVTLFL